MNEQITRATLSALKHYGDKATLKYYEFLKRGEFKTTICRNCQKKFFPPRSICPSCLSEVDEWVDMARTGVIYAFTQQERALRFTKPDVIGIVVLDSGERVLTKINGKFEELQIGMKVRLELLKLNDDVTLHTFTPVSQ